MERSRTTTSSTRATGAAGTTHQVRDVIASGEPGSRWYVDALPFRFRGALDRLAGGHGRAHRPPGRPLLEAGDRAGFWLVEDSADDRLLLRAEVRAPGVVQLLTTWKASGPGQCLVRQTVTFTPHGLLGRAYLLADLPAREAVIELAHRRLLQDIATNPAISASRA